MTRFLKIRGLDVAVAAGAFSVLVTEPAWALITVPGPDSGAIAGAAIVGAMVIAKIWYRK